MAIAVTVPRWNCRQLIFAEVYVGHRTIINGVKYFIGNGSLMFLAKENGKSLLLNAQIPALKVAYEEIVLPVV